MESQVAQYYVENIFGILHDEFNYNRCNKEMSIPMKTFLKKQACNPESITKVDYDACSVMADWKEKLRVSIVVMQAKK